MSKQLDKGTLEYLGIDFQYKLVKCFVEEPSFYSGIAQIVTQNSFSDDRLRKFVGIIIDYYDKVRTVPSYETILTALRERAKTDIELEECNALVDKIKFETTFEGYEMTKEYAVKFFKQQNFVKVANKILEYAKNGDLEHYEDCQKLLEHLSEIGTDEDMGHSPFELEADALSPTTKVPIPTGIEKLDAELNGGLEKKKIGVLIGSAGFGKSTFSTSIANFASTYKCQANNWQGFKVLQIYFEDDNVDIARKHFSKITQCEARNLTATKEHINKVREILDNFEDREMMNNNLRLKQFLAHTKSATDIENFIRKLTNMGWKPDLVIIDYFECLLPERGGFSTDSEWARESNTMRKIENMAKSLDVAIWVPTQGNKGSITSPDVVTMDQAGGSIRKVQIAHVVISIARNIADQNQNRATLAILKNRSGRSGAIFKGITFDNGTSTIICDERDELDDALKYVEEEKKYQENRTLELTRKLRDKQRNGYQTSMGESLPPL